MTMLLNGTNGVTFPSGHVSNGLSAIGVAVSTSGTAVDFTIPTTAKRVTVTVAGVSTSGANAMLVQLGPSGGPETSGYTGGGYDGTATYATAASGFSDNTGSGTSVREQVWVFNLHDPATNTWMCSMLGGFSVAGSRHLAGRKALAGLLNKLRVTTVGGTDTFDAGSINVTVE